MNFRDIFDALVIISGSILLASAFLWALILIGASYL
jgi:hypothetical protein